MTQESEPIQESDGTGRIRKITNGFMAVINKMGAGFAEDNKGHEHGSREDRIVAVTKIPDHPPKDL